MQLKRNHLFIIIPLSILALFLLSAWILTAERDAELEFTVVDAVSRAWIHELTVETEKSYMLSFYQTEFLFDNLERGEATLTVTAPQYAPVTRTVNLKRGSNKLGTSDGTGTIELQGLRIPDLDYFLVFEKEEGGDYRAQIRPVDSEGKGIVYHPCLDIRVGCRIWEAAGSKETGERGTLLYSGVLDWSWDDSFAQVYRYYAQIDGSEIRPSEADTWIIDYLILVPKPRTEDVKERMDSIAEKAGAIQNQEQLIDYLQREEEYIDYYFDTSTDVEAL